MRRPADHRPSDPGAPILPAIDGAQGREGTPVTGHVFISYSRSDTAYVADLSRFLEVAGVPVWIDTHLDYGDRWEAVVRDQVDSWCGVRGRHEPRVARLVVGQPRDRAGRGDAQAHPAGAAGRDTDLPVGRDPVRGCDGADDAAARVRGPPARADRDHHLRSDRCRWAGRRTGGSAGTGVGRRRTGGPGRTGRSTRAGAHAHARSAAGHRARTRTRAHVRAPARGRAPAPAGIAVDSRTSLPPRPDRPPHPPRPGVPPDPRSSPYWWW